MDVAKKATKKSKGGNKQVQSSGPMAALYNLDAGTSRGDVVRAVLAQRGIRVKTVTADHLNDPVGAVAGLQGFKPTSHPFEGEVPTCEFMLLNNVTSSKLNELLAAMREADCSVGCKAQVTQHNRLWPFAMLVREVSREHELMMAREQE